MSERIQQAQIFLMSIELTNPPRSGNFFDGKRSFSTIVKTSPRLETVRKAPPKKLQWGDYPLEISDTPEKPLEVPSMRSPSLVLGDLRTKDISYPEAFAELNEWLTEEKPFRDQTWREKTIKGLLSDVARSHDI